MLAKPAWGAGGFTPLHGTLLKTLEMTVRQRPLLITLLYLAMTVNLRLVLLLFIVNGRLRQMIERRSAFFNERRHICRSFQV